MELQQPFLKLPWQFDAERLASEVEALSERYWLDHPSGLPGNSAVPLVSVDGAMNHAFDGAMKPTEALMKSHYIHQAIASFGEVVARSRLMRLAPGAQVAEHVDFNYHWVSRVRIHIPIITNPQVNFYCGDESVHMAQGESWLFDSWLTNFSVAVTSSIDSSSASIVCAISCIGVAPAWGELGQQGRGDGYG